MIDTSKMLFRSSSLGDIATQKWPSVTADKKIIENIIFNEKGLVNDRENKYTLKGTKNEGEGIIMLGQYLESKGIKIGSEWSKNIERKEDEYTSGECDIDHAEDDVIYDIKCSYDWTTFAAETCKGLDIGYAYQVRDYQRLYGRKNGAVVHVLTNTPDDDIRHQIYMESFKWQGDMPDYRKVRIIRQHVYDFPTFERLIQEHLPTIDNAGADELLKFREWTLEQRINIKPCNITDDFQAEIERIVTRARERAEELAKILKM
jgi:hypothetical protein